MKGGKSLRLLPFFCLTLSGAPNAAEARVLDAIRAAGVIKFGLTANYPPFAVTKAWLIQNDPPLIAAVNKALSAALASGEWKRDMDAAH